MHRPSEVAPAVCHAMTQPEPLGAMMAVPVYGEPSKFLPATEYLPPTSWACEGPTATTRHRAPSANFKECIDFPLTRRTLSCIFEPDNPIDPVRFDCFSPRGAFKWSDGSQQTADRSVAHQNRGAGRRRGHPGAGRSDP